MAGDYGITLKQMIAAVLRAITIGSLIALLSCRPTDADADRARSPLEPSTTAESLEPGRSDSVDAILADYPTYETVAVFEGSMSAVGTVETLILINDPDRIRDAGIYDTLQRLIWVPEDLTRNEHVDVLFLSTGYTTEELKMLTPFIESLGSPHQVFGFTDLTGDGLDELLVLGTHGMGSSLLIVTVADGEVAYLMRGQEHMHLITAMELLSPRGETPVRFRLEGLRMVEGSFAHEETESPWRWAEYAWNAESGEFEASDYGILEEHELE